MFVVVVLAFLLSLSVHEASHALAGALLGDPTAKRANRLTLNPLSHIDVFGFITLLTIGFGWGKPVPFNPYNLKYPRWGPTLVALAGPLSNLCLGILFSLLLAVLAPRFSPTNLLVNFLAFAAVLNFGLMLFNLIPVAPLDGSKPLLAFLDRHGQRGWQRLIEERGPLLLLILVLMDAVFGFGIFSWISQASLWLVEVISHISIS